MSCTEKNIAHDVYNAEKKSYIVKCQVKKNLTPQIWEKSSYLN